MNTFWFDCICFKIFYMYWLHHTTMTYTITTIQLNQLCFKTIKLEFTKHNTSISTVELVCIQLKIKLV